MQRDQDEVAEKMKEIHASFSSSQRDIMLEGATESEQRDIDSADSDEAVKKADIKVRHALHRHCTLWQTLVLASHFALSFSLFMKRRRRQKPVLQVLAAPTPLQQARQTNWT